MVDWGARAASMLAQLSQLSEPGPGVTRLPYTPEHHATIDLLRTWMEAAGLSVTLDDAGTLIGHLHGPPGVGTLIIGSHQDSVREGGAYDGIMGVVLPLLALEKLRIEKVSLPFAVDIVVFADEEGVRFPTALIGSRALAGNFDPSVLDMQDSTGVSLRAAMKNFGLNPDGISALKRNQNDVLGFLETHIEQGPVLEFEDEPVGVVTAICGIERHQITIKGETGHAGTLPMEGRHDALVAAAAIVTEVNQLAMRTPDLRATVGALRIEPNVVNAVPHTAHLTAELRSPDDDIRRNAGRELHRFAGQLADENRIHIDCERTYSQTAQRCSDKLTSSLQAAVLHAGGRGITLPSGATHDASAMAGLGPMAMLFVRSRDGISHKPEEFTASEDMHVAINVLSQFLRTISADLIETSNPA